MTSIQPKPAAKKFEAVFDSDKRKVRGLWKRSSRYYAQLNVDVGNGRRQPRRIPLPNAVDLATARVELARRITERADGKLDRSRQPARPAMLPDFVERYLASPVFAYKKSGSQQTEHTRIKHWVKHLGAIRLDQISVHAVARYREARLRRVCPRTVNLEVIALRQVLLYAKELGLVSDVLQFFSPTRGGGLKSLRWRPPPKRPLLTKEQFATLLQAATEETTQNAEQLRFYLRFLALTGAREHEALSVARRDVNFEQRFVTIGADGDSKNSKSRTVDFSPELQTLLKELEAWLPPDTSWLFPSPKRGRKDVHAQSLQASFKLIRERAGLERVGLHDCRHFFASQCVMAGVDFMTISEWLGHSDGGILVGKVYGHLADAHKQEAACKLRFFK